VQCQGRGITIASLQIGVEIRRKGDSMAATNAEQSPSAAKKFPRVVLIAASADGIGATSQIIRALPRDFPAAVVIVQHRPPFRPSLLTNLLASRTDLVVTDATTGHRLRPGTIYLAKPDRHLMFSETGTFRYTDGTRIRFLRSSANPLFESAAKVFGTNAVAVVLTGSGMDGTDGVQAVKSRGGTVIAQDPATASHSSMPTAAIRTGVVDYVLPIDQIAPKLVQLMTKAA
jgi:two-component system chemotaxis response regulator CheB